jgi:8-oxo-dGTP pyrophosphatase MutT (NUDIX family)
LNRFSVIFLGSFSKGYTEEDGWWHGNSQGKDGVFPGNFVSVVSKPEAKTLNSDSLPKPWRKIQTALECAPTVKLDGGKRRASVAILLRCSATTDGLDMCLIKRADRKGDRWSGDVALPGGKVDKDETPLEAVKREVKEEIGLDLDARYTQGGVWCLLGQVSDQPAMEMVVSVFVFGLTAASVQGASPTRTCTAANTHINVFRLNPGEVAECGWCSVDYLCRQAHHFVFLCLLLKKCVYLIVFFGGGVL